MHRLALLVTGIATFAGLGRAAAAQTLYATGFENPPFQGGLPLVGQDGWVNQIYKGSPLGPNGAISTAHPANGLQGVQEHGSDLTTIDTGYAAAAYRKFVDFDAAAAGFPVVRVEADVRLDGPQTTQTDDRITGDFFSANLATFSPDGDLGEMSLSSDGHIYGYSSFDANYDGFSYLFEVPFTFGKYYNLGLDLNFAARTTTFLLDGQVLGVQPFTPSFTSNVLSRGSLTALAIDPDDLGRDRSAYTSHYDNFSIRAGVPEPSSLLLAALGFLGLAFYPGRMIQ